MALIVERCPTCDRPPPDRDDVYRAAMTGNQILALPYGDVDVSAASDHDPAVYTEDRAEEEFLASHAYRETFGPAYYSFNAGDDHWVVMNDMQYINYPGNKKRYPGVVGDRNYSGNYTDAQIAWLAVDL